MREPIQPAGPRPKINRVEVYWTTMTYRALAIYLLLGFAVVMAVIYMMNPSWVGKVEARLDHAFGGGESGHGALVPGQVRFVNLDGSVRVKTQDSVTWETAGYGITLDKGDLIQTGPDGLARLSFPDGTTYTVKADTLVRVEENSVAGDKSTQVGVHIDSGTVDLATPSWDSPRSKAEISFADAHASMKENSRAAVHSNAAKDEGDITIVSGAADVRKGDQSVELNKWERATINGSGAEIVKTNVLAPPDLLQPLNLEPIIQPDPKQATIRFEWKAVPDAVEYVLKVSSNSAFNKVAKEERLSGTVAEVTGLDAGDYFWNVVAVGPSKKESDPSDTHKFTLVAQGKGQDMLLEVDQTVLHGNLVELIGHTEPGSALIINGQPVADITPDGHFRFFTDALAKGSQTIVITGQNRRGGTAIQRVQIVIP